MKVLLSTLNAKYIHTSLALRLLYVANKHKFNISFKEFTLKEDIETIAQQILSTECNILGLAVYIWNVNELENLVKLLREKNPSLIIILGGPEVSYEPKYFLDNWSIDYVVCGEGEFVLGELLQAIQNSTSTDIDAVCSKNHYSSVVARADLNAVAALPSPYMLEEDLKDMGSKVIYFESSRGCPYQCQYCLSSLEMGVRYFPKKYIKENLLYLINSKVRLIKFLDRTFNLNKTHTSTIYQLLIENYRESLSCQFEIYADILKSETISYLNSELPKNYFRFEIGIQSTHEPTVLAVKRKQNFQLLYNNIEELMQGGKIDLHLDLIAGLPYETFNLFIESFNNVFSLKAKEVQLGFLKLLRGTALRNNAHAHGYKYNIEAPYQIISNNYISQEELERIHKAEYTLEKYWNSGKFKLSLNKILLSTYKNKYFQFFEELANYYIANKFLLRGYQLEDLYVCLNNFMLGKGINMVSLLRQDYYANFKQRPTSNWHTNLTKQEKRTLHYSIGQDKEFLKKHNLTRKIIEKQTAIDKENNKLILTIFLENKKPFRIMYFKKNIVNKLY